MSQLSRQSRRTFLRQAGLFGAGAAVLAAGCGRPGGSEPETQAQLVRLFSSDNVIAAGIPQRLPFGLVNSGAPVLTSDQPVLFRVMFEDLQVDEVAVRPRLVGHDDVDASAEHEHSSILRYFALRTTLPEPGIYDLLVDVEGTEISVPVQAFDPSDVKVLLPGAGFPLLGTPTLDQPQPMDTICTILDGPCPFHTTSVAEVIAAGSPLAFLISSPAYCVTSYCGPVLNELIAANPTFPSIQAIHLEVYENPKEVGGNINDPDIRPVKEFEALGLTYEPALFLIDRNGVLIDRIDNVYDQDELATGLARIA